MKLLLITALQFYGHMYGEPHSIYINPSMIMELEDNRLGIVCSDPQYQVCERKRICEITFSEGKSRLKEAVRGSCKDLIQKIEEEK